MPRADRFALRIPDAYAGSVRGRRRRAGRIDGMHPAFLVLGGTAGLVRQVLDGTETRAAEVARAARLSPSATAAGVPVLRAFRAPRPRGGGGPMARRAAEGPARSGARAAECLPAGRAPRQYDPGMSDRKTRVTVTIDPHLAAYAERLGEAGKAPSVSAVVNGALEAGRQGAQKARRLWREAAEHADPDKVARMLAHVEAQAAQLPASHRYR